MRLVGIDQVKNGELLGKTLYDLDGRRLLSVGVGITPSILQKLHEKGITSVYIEDEFSEGIEINDIISDDTKNLAKNTVRDEMHRLSQKKEIDCSAVGKVVDNILDEILSQKTDLMSFKDIRLNSEKYFAHAVNVCVMATALGVKLSLPPMKVKSIALGAILHDMGKALLPASIYNKETPLTKAEEHEYKKHPILGYNIIKDSLDISATTKVAVLMHHENINGSGYPMGLGGDKIHYSAKVIAVCNAYDNSINDKKYKNVLQTTDAIEYLVGSSGHLFDKSIVDTFIHVIPVYVEGSIVLLSNGSFAIVVKNNPISLTRPVVRVLYNPKTKTRYSKDYQLDLGQELSIKIMREIVVDINEIIGS